MYQKSGRDFRIECFFRSVLTPKEISIVGECLNLSTWREHATLSGNLPLTGEDLNFSNWEDVLSKFESSEWINIYQTEEVEDGKGVNFRHDATGTSIAFSGTAEDSAESEEIFLQLTEFALRKQELEYLMIVTLPFDNYGLRGVDIPRCVAPFHVHCYKAAYRQDYYTQFMSREDMLRLPAYKVTEREDGAVITQIYPDLMEGESPEALDYMERCAVHFKKYHRTIDTSINNNPINWAEGGFHYERERRLFGPNGLDGVVPQDLGLL